MIQLKLLNLFIKISTFLFLLLGNLTCVYCQDTTTAQQQYNYHLSQANKYSDVALYIESANEYNLAIKIAEGKGWEDKYIDANISLAELMRKTRNFEKGFEIIFDLKNTENYPKLRIRKLGRLAALYQESSNPERMYYLDSAKINVKKALNLVKDLDLPEEKASLYNEYGFLIYKYENRKKEGFTYYKKAAELFLELKDSVNYANVMIHVLEHYHNTKNYSKSDSLIPVLFNIVQFKKCDFIKIDLYSEIAQGYKEQGDSLKYYEWKLKEKIIVIEYLELSYSK